MINTKQHDANNTCKCLENISTTYGRTEKSNTIILKFILFYRTSQSECAGGAINIINKVVLSAHIY